MQKVINVLAIASFVVSGAVVGASVYAYLKLPTLIEEAKKKAIEEVTGALPGMIQSAMPSMPGSTGDVLNVKPSIPGL